ncbi:hypothetical protein BOX15_Mlig023149g1 [Macrostomum lignano]|uniref:Uncharacterized protein n=2 Tax=Macrostomum lignano TaxID=282301 RepID=A0A267ELP3_9PLAT|nr:hypothetical protein BOX15_Mlig023149g1 [Macrostomum lignano]
MGECLANIPYASVIAFVLVLIGGCVMTGTLYEAVRQTDVYFRSTFYPIEELLYVQIASVVVSPVTVVLAVILLTFGILATGATRNKIYRGDRCILGGRFSAGLFMAFSYLLSLVWVGIACFLMIPIVGYIMMDKVCYEEWTYWRDIDGEKTNAKFFTYFKFNLTHYGLYKKLYTFRPELKFNETITTATAFQNFCSKIGTIGPLYAFAWAGAVFVIFGLMCFIGALSANFTKLKYTKELTDYRAAGEVSTEMDYLGKSMDRPTF